jgi:F-type H+-transporting ATPase subunit delta
MAERTTIARPYARAAFAYAQAHDGLARWSNLLAKAALVVADSQVAKLLGNPHVRSADLVSLIGDACGADLDDHGRNFLATLANNRRLAILPQIAELYEELRAEVENVADVEITSAVALDDTQRTRLSKALEKRLRRSVRLHCAVDPSLIGGAVVRSGDMVIDGSVKARLERLAADMTH